MPAGRRRVGCCHRSSSVARLASVFLLAVILATPDIAGDDGRGLAGGFPIATIITSNLTLEILPGITFGEIYLFVILASVFVCTLAIQGAATRLMFSMGRDRHLPFGGVWGNVNQLQDSGQRRHRGGRHRRPADPVGRPVRRLRAVDHGHRAHLRELLPVQPRRVHRAPQGLAAQGGLVQARQLGTLSTCWP